MICAEFLAEPGGRVLGFSITGHSDLGEEGEDILCASVSSAAYLTANAVTEILKVSPASLRVRDGDMLLQVEPKDEPRCRDFLSALRLHLIALEGQYPGNLQVDYRELSF